MIVFVVSLALLMEAVDTTAINTAIPAMATSLAVHPIDLKLALISYLLSLAIFIPISGWMADKFGIKRVFMTAIVIFILSSIWCGFSKTLAHLVLARLLQGLGGSLMLPLGRLILLRTFPRHEFINVMSRVALAGALGLMLGPVLGGFFTHYLSWEWIFWINVPAGIVAIIVAYLWLEPSPPKAVPRLDKMGFVLFSMGLAGLTFGLSEIGETTAHKVIALNTLLLSVLLLGLYIVHSRRKAHPIVNGALFQSRPFRISVLGNLLSRLGFGGLPFLLPLLLQIGLDYSPQDAGILIAPIALGILLIKPFSLKILRYLGFKRLLIYNTFAVSLCLISFSAINSNTSLFFIILLTFFFGFLSTLQYSGMNTLAYAEVTPEQLSGATSIMSTMQQVSQSFGVAISAIFLRYFSMGLKLTLSDFHHAFIGIGLITLCSMIIFLRLKPEDGLQLIKEAGHKPPTV